MALSPNVVVVAPGELITAQHLNNIRANLDRIDISAAGRVPMTGTSAASPMTGNLWLGGNPTTGGGALVDATGQIQLSRVGPTTGSPNMILGRGAAPGAGAALEPFMQFYRSASSATPQGTLIGTIRINASANGIEILQTSDPRTKQRDGDVVDAAERARQLGHAAFSGRMLHADTGEPVGEPRDLISSHDIGDVAPYAVHGERDAVDDAGNPIYQTVEYAALLPLAFAALAAAFDRIAALEAAAA